MKARKKLILPIIILIITFIITIVSILIQNYYISTYEGILMTNEILYSFVQFALSIVLLLLFDYSKKECFKKINVIVTIMLLFVSLWLGVRAIGIYYRYLDSVVNKLVYISTTNAFFSFNVYFNDNAMGLFISVVALLLVIFALLTVLLFTKPLINHIRFVIKKVVLSITIKDTIIPINISIGFLYKSVP